MKFLITLTAIFWVAASAVSAQQQTVKIDPDVAKHLAEVKALIKDPKAQKEDVKSGKLAPGYTFNPTLILPFPLS